MQISKIGQSSSTPALPHSFHQQQKEFRMSSSGTDRCMSEQMNHSLNWFQSCTRNIRICCGEDESMGTIFSCHRGREEVELAGYLLTHFLSLPKTCYPRIRALLGCQMPFWQPTNTLQTLKFIQVAFICPLQLISSPEAPIPSILPPSGNSWYHPGTCKTKQELQKKQHRQRQRQLEQIRLTFQTPNDISFSSKTMLSRSTLQMELHMQGKQQLLQTEAAQMNREKAGPLTHGIAWELSSVCKTERGRMTFRGAQRCFKNMGHILKAGMAWLIQAGWRVSRASLHHHLTLICHMFLILLPGKPLLWDKHYEDSFLYPKFSILFPSLI